MPSGVIRLENRLGTCAALVLAAHCMMAQTVTPAEGADREMRPPASVQRAGYVPMTQKDRLEYYFRHMFSAESVLRSAAGAGINQALNTPSEWHQGAEGYGRRFASIYGNHIIQSTVMYGTSAILHEDNRYFRSGLSGFGPRFQYAIASTFLARHDDGSRHPSISRLGSDIDASVVSRFWQPRSTDKLSNAADAFGIAIGVEAGFNVAREFLPAIFHSRGPVASQRPRASAN